MYSGHVYFGSPTWVANIPALPDRVSPTIACRHRPERFITNGNPVFIAVRGGDAIQLRTCVGWPDVMTAADIRGKYGRALDCDGFAEGADPDAPLQFAMLNQSMFPVDPPVSLSGLGIRLPDARGLHELTPQQVLAVLKALPPMAQDDWTRRVVARNNDLHLLPKGAEI